MELGTTKAGPRTRAYEAYRLGMLRGRLVSGHGGLDIPVGWEEVIRGVLPHSQIGLYAYLIGEASTRQPSDHHLIDAIDCLAAVKILHIGFLLEDQWYSTVLVYEYARQHTESLIGRTLTHQELRYLAAGVFNTLDGPHRELLLEPYRQMQTPTQLAFEVSSKDYEIVDVTAFLTFVHKDNRSFHDFTSEKAPLFWIGSPNEWRGIYTRAMRSAGAVLIGKYVDVDRRRFSSGNQNLLTPLYVDGSERARRHDSITLMRELFSGVPDLSAAWDRLEETLERSVNYTVSALRPAQLRPVWLAAQQLVRRPDERHTPLAELIKGFPEHALTDGDQRKEVGDSVDSEHAKDLATDAFDARIQAYVNDNYDFLLSPPPPEADPAEHTRKRTISTRDFAESDARNRRLGVRGEEFIVAYEVQRLTKEGRADLAKKVVWAAKDIGDGLGYDVASFEVDGRDRFIEVKTTNSGIGAPFYVTNNEIMMSRENPSQYFLYRVYDFRREPRLFVLEGPIDESLKLAPVVFRARV